MDSSFRWNDACYMVIPMTTQPHIYALIVAAGTGTRAGGELPKQYQTVGGKAMLRHSCETLVRHPGITGVQVVIRPEDEALYTHATEGLGLLPPVYGGTERTDSVRAGLNALSLFHPDYVLIHDAARPFLPRPVLDAILDKLVMPGHAMAHAVAPAIAVPDTVRRLTDGQWHEVPREGLMRIQTPQAFPFAALHRLALENPSPGGGGSFTDDVGLWLAAGLPLEYIIGSEELRKVTTSADLADAEQHSHHSHTIRWRTAIGMGVDVHELMPAGDKQVMRLGGIDIPHGHALYGHSDADVVLHAIADAIYGALAEGDIGAHFPPSDARLKGADSKIFIDHARARIAAHSGVLQHLDVTILCEQPKIAPHRDSMRQAIATMLKVPLARVAVKATTTEKLGFTGREEGIMANAVVTILLPEEP